jgi:homoserine O-acetyltransferase
VSIVSTLALVLLAAGAQSVDTRAVLLDPQHPFWRAAAPRVFQVEFETTKGVFVIEVHREWAPRGADRFYNLVRAGFFDDSRFFRVRAGRFAQFGIPGDRALAAVWRNHTMPDDPVRQSNIRGAIAYAMTGPSARTTQLYINLTDNVSQDADGFAPIGTVIAGLERVDQLWAGYGEEAGGGMRGGKQNRIFAEGNVHLDRDFPQLDKLVRARLRKR